MCKDLLGALKKEGGVSAVPALDPKEVEKAMAEMNSAEADAAEKLDDKKLSS